jgi:putative peptide zinc metalloprotease protein
MQEHLNPRARTDLEYRTVEMGEQEVVIVADPVRGAYFKYNPLQAAMLQAMDGTRTREQVLALLGFRFDIWVSRSGATKFLEQLQSRLLLDVSMYPLPGDGPVHAKTCRALRRRGYVAGRKQGAPSALGERPDHPERALLHDALAALEAGRLEEAKDALVALRERRPDDARCRELLKALQDAFIRASTPPSTDYPALPLFNPDRLLGVLARAVGGFLFSWKGALALVALLAAAVAAWADTSFAEVQVGAADAFGGYLIFLVALFVHEFAHGLACRHFGGAVREMGFFFLYFVQPVPYCDTSSSYLFDRKRHKVMVQLSGALGSLVASAWMALLLWTLPPYVAVYPSLLVAFTLNTGYAVMLNAIPLMKLDGYYALADALEIPNLRERAFEYCSLKLAHALVGGEPPAEPARKERRVFLLYAPLAALFSLAWMAFVYVRFVVGPLLGRFQGLGLLVGLALALGLSWKVIGRPLARAARFASGNWRRLSRSRLVAGAAAAVAVPALALLVPWPVMVDVPFTVAPAQRAQVRAEVEGRVEAVAVAEGERVRRGQLLGRLRNDVLARDLAAAEASVEAARDRLALLEHGPRPEAVAVLARRLEQAVAALRWEQGRSARVAGHAARGLDSEASAANAALEEAGASAAAEAAERAMALERAGARAEDLAAAKAEVARAEARRDELRAAVARLDLRSPIDGTVVTARPEELSGRQLQPGALLLEVHDLAQVRGELQLDPSSPLAEVKPEDAVALVAEGFPGLLVESRVDRLAPAAGAAELLAFTHPFVLQGARSGMRGHARIYGGRRSLGYTFVVLPLRRFLRVELWSLF